MFRKFVLAASAVGALGLAALAPSAASAGYWGYHGGHHGGHHVRHYWRPPVVHYYQPDECIVRRKVWTHYGWRWTRVNVCY